MRSYTRDNRPNTNSYSSLVLLFKKKDESWCFYVDYCALNSVIVLSKFPISVNKGLLGELQGSAFIASFTFGIPLDQNGQTSLRSLFACLKDIMNFC